MQNARLGLFFLTSFMSLASAQEIIGSAGITATQESDQGSASWATEFSYNTLENLALSAGYFNETGVPGHHRDGFDLQASGRIPIYKKQLWLEAGTGPYYYFDTQSDKEPSKDVHGWAPMFNAGLVYYLESPWFFRTRITRVQSRDDISTSSLLFGVGYRLDTKPSEQIEEREDSSRVITRNEFTMFAGETILNTSKTPTSLAMGVEYRRGLSKYWDITILALDEGDAGISRRQGVGSQLWLVDEYLNRRLTLGIGAGPYIYKDRGDSENEGSWEPFGGLASLTASYRLSSRWLLRFIFNRVITDEDLDSDTFLLGIGYRY